MKSISHPRPQQEINNSIDCEHGDTFYGRHTAQAIELCQYVKAMEVNVFENNKQSRIGICMKFRYISDKTGVK